MDILNRKGLVNSNYFDDFFKEDGYAKNYRQILFHPGRVPQTREFTQLQTILNEYSKNYLDTVFKNGSVIAGCYLDIFSNDDVQFLRINEGLIYFDGSVYKTNDITLELTDDIKYTFAGVTELNVSIGIMPKFELIHNTGNTTGEDAEEQLALLDPAIQYFDTESVVGADRLKVTFNIVLIIPDGLNLIYFYCLDGETVENVVNDFDFDNYHFFDFSRNVLNYVDNIFSVSNITYLNREAKISDILNIKYNISDEIIEGLNIQHSNQIDRNINITSNISDKPGIPNGLSYVNVERGIGKINGVDIPVSRNTFFKFTKPSELEDGSNLEENDEYVYYYKDSSSEEDGIYFKYFIPDMQSGVIGSAQSNFDNSRAFSHADIGRAIAIEQFNQSTNKYETIATANICHITDTVESNTNIKENTVWDKYRYKGFWKKNEDCVYIQGMIPSGDAKIYRDSVDSHKIYLTGATTKELLRHGTSGGVNAIAQEFTYSGVIFSERQNLFDDTTADDFEWGQFKNNTKTRYTIDNATLISDITNGKITKYCILVVDNALYYILDVDDGIMLGVTPSITICKLSYAVTNDKRIQIITNIAPEILGDLASDETATKNIKIIRYHVIDEILGEDSFSIEYNGNNSDNYFNMAYLSSAMASAESFYIISSPWEDLAGMRTLIKKEHTTPTTEDMYFVLTEPQVPMFAKYILFFEGLYRTHIIPQIPIVCIYEDDTVSTTYNRFIIRLQNDIIEQYNIKAGDIIEKQPDDSGFVFPYVIVDEVVNSTDLKVYARYDPPAGITLPEMNVANSLVITNNETIFGSAVFNNQIFWKIKTIHYSAIGSNMSSNLTAYTNKTTYGAYNNLKELFVTYHSSNYKKVFINNINLIGSSYGIETLYNNDNSMRVVMISGDDVDYDSIIEKGVSFQTTKDIIKDTDNKTIKNDFNDLANPFVKDNPDYSVYTLLNWDTNISNFVIEDNANWAQFNFTEEQKVLGIYQVYGRCTRNFVSDKMFIKIQGTGCPIFKYNENPPLTTINYDQPSLNTVYYYDVNDDMDFQFYTNHQNDMKISNGLANGNLGINIKYFNDSQFVEEITFLTDSYGVGSGVDREFSILNDKGETVPVEKGTGLKYYFNLDLGKDLYNINGDKKILKYIAQPFIVYETDSWVTKDSKTQNAWIDSSDKHKIHCIQYGEFDAEYVGEAGDPPSRQNIIIKKDATYPDGIFRTWDSSDFSSGLYYFYYLDESSGNVVLERIVSATPSGNNIQISLENAIPPSVDIVQGNIVQIRVPFSFIDNAVVGDVFYFYKETIKGDQKTYEIDFYKIKTIESATTITVYEEVSDKFTQSANYNGFIVELAPENSKLTAPMNTKIWLPYENNYKFNIANYNIADTDSTTFGNQILTGTVITTNEIQLIAGETVSLSLYKEVMKSETWDSQPITAGVDVTNIDSEESYHPFMRVRENLTADYGKPMSFKHEPLLYPVSHPELKEVLFYPTVKVDYENILPDVVHFHLNTEGIVDYTYTNPQKYDSIEPYYIQDKLYLGTTIIPPILENKAFLTTSNDIFNFNDKIKNYFDNIENKKDIAHNSNMIINQETYNNERRDLLFSTGKKFVYWERLSGIVIPKLSNHYVTFSRTASMEPNNEPLAQHPLYIWDTLEGIDTNFLTELNCGDIIGVYSETDDYPNDKISNPESVVYYNPTETFEVKKIISNNKLIIDGEMLTIKIGISTIGEQLPPTDGGIPTLPKYLVPSAFKLFNQIYKTDLTNYFYGAKLFIRREVDINYIQYLLNNRDYSIHNIIKNSYDYEDGYRMLKIEDKNLYFKNDRNKNIFYKKPSVDIYNNELSPRFPTFTKTIDLTEDTINFVYSSKDDVSIKEADTFKIVDTKNYTTDILEFNSEDVINGISFELADWDGHNKHDVYNSIAGCYVLNSDKDSLKWEYSGDGNYHFLDIVRDSSDINNMNYDYMVTNKVKKNTDNIYKYTFKIATSRYAETNKGIVNIGLTEDKNITKWSGISALTFGDTVNLIASDNAISSYNDSTTFIGTGADFRFLSDASLRTYNGIYDVGIINTNITIDGSNNITTPVGVTTAILDKISTNIKMSDGFSIDNKDFSYIFNQLNNAIYFERMEIPFADISGDNVFEMFDNRVKAENWTFVKPTVYQIYQFKESYMLNTVDLFVNTPGSPSTRYVGNVAILFGFLINNELTKNGIVHTEIIHINSNTQVGISNGTISITLDTPIYIPKDTQFFIGMIKEESSTANDLEFKIIENGAYDTSSDILTTFPASINSKLVINETEYTSKILKIDLTVNKYITGQTLSVVSTAYTTANQFIKFFNFSNNIIPEDCVVKYLYSVEDDVDNPKWYQFDINKQFAFDISKKKIMFKVEVTTNNEYLSPIFKNYFIMIFQYLTFDESYSANNTNIKKISYSTLKSNNPAFLWRGIGDNDNIRFFPINMTISDIENKTNKYNRTYGEMKEETRYTITWK